MARIRTPHPISGSIGDLTFSTSDGKTIARQKPGITRQKFLTHPKLQRSRENAQAFGGASKVGCAIYSAVAFKRKGMVEPYAHNHLIARIHKAVKQHRRVVDSIGFLDVGNALRGWDLSRDSTVSGRLKTTTIGPNHCPEELKISGLREAANAAQGRGRGGMECRIQLIYLPFPAVNRTDLEGWKHASGHRPLPIHSPLTDWIPIEILPTEGLRLSLHHAQQHRQQPDVAILSSLNPHLSTTTKPSRPDPNRLHSPFSILNSNAPTLVFLAVEWREVNESETKATKLPEKGILRLVAMQMDEATAQALADQPEPKSKPHQEIRQDWRESPEAYLNQALAGLTVHTPTEAKGLRCVPPRPGLSGVHREPESCCVPRIGDPTARRSLSRPRERGQAHPE